MILSVVTTVLSIAILTPTTAPEYRIAPAPHHVALSAKALDMRGIEPSLYRGKWYDPSAEGRRTCIIIRESHGNYRAANKESSARGAYQFLDRSWRRGLVAMMLKEEIKTGGPLVAQIKALRHIPINRWNRYFQDRAFWTAWRFGDGAHHWKYPPKPC